LKVPSAVLGEKITVFFGRRGWAVIKETQTDKQGGGKMEINIFTRLPSGLKGKEKTGQRRN